MVKTSVLNDALNAINNAEKSGKRQVLIRPSSKVIIKFLTVMQRHGTLGILFCIRADNYPMVLMLYDLWALSVRYIDSEGLTSLRILP